MAKLPYCAGDDDGYVTICGNRFELANNDYKPRIFKRKYMDNGNGARGFDTSESPKMESLTIVLAKSGLSVTEFEMMCTKDCPAIIVEKTTSGVFYYVTKDFFVTDVDPNIAAGTVTFNLVSGDTYTVDGMPAGFSRTKIA